LGGLVSATLLPAVGWRAVFLVGGLLPLVLLPVLAWKLPESLYFLTLRRRDGDRVLTLLRRIDPAFAPTTALVPVAREEAGRGVPVTQLFQAGRGQGTLMLWLVFFMNLMVFYFLQNWLPIIFTDAGLSIESAVLT